MERALTSIRLIKDIKPIQNADNLELAIIDGWQVVVKKGEFKTQDKCVFFEIDSYLPIKPQYEFLRKSCYKAFPNGIEGFRLRTVKLRGELSQGLVLPLLALKISSKTPVGMDLTKKLGIMLYEPELLGQLDKKRSWICRRIRQILWFFKNLINPKVKRIKSPGTFPSYVPKTDEPRIQNLHIDNFIGKTYEESEKVDGTSCTIGIKDSNFFVCSRNNKLGLTLNENNEPTGLFNGAYYKMAIQYDLENKLKTLGKNLAIQGEIIGPKIQANKYQLETFQYYVFKIWFIDEDRYATPEERIELTTKLGLCHVPVLNVKVFDFKSVDDVLKYVEGKSKLNPQAPREGIVFKCVDGSHSFKAISNEFLLRYKD